MAYGVDRQTGERQMMGRQNNRCLQLSSNYNIVCKVTNMRLTTFSNTAQNDRTTERQIERQKDRMAERQKDRIIDRMSERRNDRQNVRTLSRE